MEYERDFYSYPQNNEPEGNPRYDDGDVGASRQDKAESDEAYRRRSYDLDGDYVDVTPLEDARGNAERNGIANHTAMSPVLGRVHSNKCIVQHDLHCFSLHLRFRLHWKRAFNLR